MNNRHSEAESQTRKNLVQKSNQLSQNAAEVASIQQTRNRAKQITKQVSRPWLCGDIQNECLKV